MPKLKSRQILYNKPPGCVIKGRLFQTLVCLRALHFLRCVSEPWEERRSEAHGAGRSRCRTRSLPPAGRPRSRLCRPAEFPLPGTRGAPGSPPHQGHGSAIGYTCNLHCLQNCPLSPSPDNTNSAVVFQTPCYAGSHLFFFFW